MRLIIFILLSMLLPLAAYAAGEAVSPQRLLYLRGIIALDTGKPLEAARYLKLVAEMTPEDWQLRLPCAEALLAAGDAEAARVQLRRATMLAPAIPDSWQAMVAAGVKLHDVDLEYAGLSGLIRVLPDNPLLQKRMAEILAAKGKKKEAQALDAAWQATLPPLDFPALYNPARFRDAKPAQLRQMALENNTNPALHAALAHALWQAGDKAGATDELKLLYGFKPGDTAVVNAYAHACLRLGSINAALDALGTLRAVDQYSISRPLIMWSYADSRFARVIDPIKRLLQNSVEAKLNRILGVAGLYGDDIDAASSGYRISWLKTADPVTAQGYASALIKAERTKEAEDILLNAIRQFPDDFTLKMQLARFYIDHDRLAEAARATLEAAKTRPGNIEFLTLAAERFIRAECKNDASAIAAQLRDKYPSNAFAVERAVDIFRGLGEYSDARLTLTRYLSPNMRSPFDETSLMLKIARYATEDGRMDEAFIALERLLKGKPRNPEALRLMGTLRSQRGQWQEAVGAYQNYLAVHPDDAGALCEMAQAARAMKNYPLAIRGYELAAKLLPTATPQLGLAQVYQAQGDEAKARDRWLIAKTLPGGKILAQARLLASYDRAGDEQNARVVLASLREALQQERALRCRQWQTSLSARKIDVTEDEIEAILLLEPDLIDPKALLERGR